MPIKLTPVARTVPYLLTAVAVCAVLLSDTPIRSLRPSGGCFGFGGFGRQSVGGVSIDANGVLENAQLDDLHKLRDVRVAATQEMSSDINQPSEMRKVSLRKLDEAIAKHLANGAPLSTEMICLGGLQNIRYVFVYPEQHDIVLVGYGEGCKIDDRGNLVGALNGRPVMMLDDLLVALRSAQQNGRSGITCSIDPTPEGMARLRAYVDKLKTIGDPQTTIANIEQTLGPQKITVGGVPETSHFARVLVAADYRMKRIGMGFEPSPVPGLASYIEMIPASGTGMQNMTPRWWMVPNYEPLLTDGQGLAWELRGGSVKTMTEDSFITSQGAKPQTGKTSAIAQKWADKMTSLFPELAKKEPIFGELRNCMDLAIVAALIQKEELAEKADVKFAVLGDAERLQAIKLDAPQQTASQASFVKKGSRWVISASGGVEIQPGEILQHVETSDQLDAVRGKVTEPQGSSRWWWN